jgi:flagellar P-ring protein precursor FlgI
MDTGRPRRHHRAEARAEQVDAVDQPGANLAIVRGTNLNTLVGGLNRIGLKPNGIIAILQAIKSAGALQADLVVQ